MLSCPVGVCLSRYSDLLQVEPLMPGARGEIIIFKVMKVNAIICQSQNTGCSHTATGSEAPRLLSGENEEHL